MPLAIALQDAVTGQHFSFDPTRTIENVYPEIVRIAIQACRRNSWQPWMVTLLEPAGVDENVLLETLYTFSVAVDLSMEPNPNTVIGAVREAGFLSKPQSAQTVVLALLGQLCFGAFWAGVRHANMQGVVPEVMVMMRQAAQQLEEFIREDWNTKAAHKIEGTSCNKARSSPSEELTPASDIT
jgi:hypothetical protein